MKKDKLNESPWPRWPIGIAIILFVIAFLTPIFLILGQKIEVEKKIIKGEPLTLNEQRSFFVQKLLEKQGMIAPAPKK